MPIPTLSLAVVGVNHANHNPKKRGNISRRFEITLCQPGEPVALELEPDNPADPNAVRVMSARGVQLGYVRAERAALIGGYISQGIDIRAVFQSEEGWGATIRITTDGSEPVLPPALEKPAESRNPEPDWYPDEDWSD